MARAIWSGQLSFGLISIPVGLYAALEASERVGFRQLHRKDLAPIRYKKFCSKEDREVPSSEIVRGYEVSKGRYAVVERRELEGVQDELGEGEHTIEILQFVDFSSLNPLLFEKPYYLTPQKGGGKAYGVLRQALCDSRKVGIARLYLRTRPLLAALVPNADVLSLEVIRNASELRDPRELSVKETAARANEVEMARALIEEMSGEWDPTDHPNAYRKALEKLIAKKPTVDVSEGARAKPSGKVVDLMEALKGSLEASRKRPAARKKGGRQRSAA